VFSEKKEPPAPEVNHVFSEKKEQIDFVRERFPTNEEETPESEAAPEDETETETEESVHFINRNSQ